MSQVTEVLNSILNQAKDDSKTNNDCSLKDKDCFIHPSRLKNFEHSNEVLNHNESNNIKTEDIVMDDIKTKDENDDVHSKEEFDFSLNNDKCFIHPDRRANFVIENESVESKHNKHKDVSPKSYFDELPVKGDPFDKYPVPHRDLKKNKTEVSFLFSVADDVENFVDFDNKKLILFDKNKNKNPVFDKESNQIKSAETAFFLHGKTSNIISI